MELAIEVKAALTLLLALTLAPDLINSSAISTLLFQAAQLYLSKLVLRTLTESQQLFSQFTGIHL